MVRDTGTSQTSILDKDQNIYPFVNSRTTSENVVGSKAAYKQDPTDTVIE